MEELGNDYLHADEAESDIYIDDDSEIDNQDEDDINDIDDIEDEVDEDEIDTEQDKQDAKISYPSIDKILKETQLSPYFKKIDNDEFTNNYENAIAETIKNINEIALKQLTTEYPKKKDFNAKKRLEKEVIVTYSIIHDMTVDFMQRRNEILNSDESNWIFKQFYIYKEVLKRKRKIYLDDLAEANIRTVYYVVQKFRANNDYDELVSVGMMGYAKALDKFSPVRGIKFATFAIHCIYNEILFYLRKEKKIKDHNVSINTKLSTDKNGNDLVLEDIVPDTKPNPEEHIKTNDTKNTLIIALRGLAPTERYIIIYRYGIDRGIVLTQKDIAQKLDMSQANISKIEKNSLDKLEEMLRNEPL